MNANMFLSVAENRREIGYMTMKHEKYSNRKSANISNEYIARFKYYRRTDKKGLVNIQCIQQYTPDKNHDMS